MILRDPYDFRGLRFTKNNAIFQDINRYIISEYSYLEKTQLLKLNTFQGEIFQLKPVILYGLTAIEKEVPSFNHPLVNENNKWIALDLRQVVTADPQTMKVTIRNENEFNFMVQKFVLSALWATGKYQPCYGLKLPQLIFGDWLSTNMVRKFGLSMADQVRLSVLAMLYYSHLFTDSFDEDDLQKLKIRLKGEIYSDDLIDEVYKATSGNLSTLEGFCKACYTVTGNVRLQNFDFNVLISVVSNNWFGLNSQELILLALSHPPTWISLVYAALTQRSFKNSYVTKVVDQRNKRGLGEEFLKELVHMTKTYKEE